MREDGNIDGNILYQYASKLCAGHEMCRADVLARLSRRGAGQDVAEAVLDRLEDEGFIDEERYVRAFVHDKLQFERWGRVKIAASLSQKRISKSVYGPVLDEVDETMYKGILRDVIAAKRRMAGGDDDRNTRLRIARFAIGRGFEPRYVFSLLDVDGMEDE